MIITWLTRYSEVIGTVRALAAQYSAGVDGTDELTLLTTDNVEKGQRLMWRDDNDRITGLVHEMIVSSARTVHDKRGKALTEVKAINSIAELYWTDVPKQSGIYVPHYTGQVDSEGNPIQNGWVLDDLMEGILDGTRWEWVDGTHFDIGGAIAYVGMREMYDVSVREIIAAAAAGFSGSELRTYVFADYDTCEVTHRYVSIAYPLHGSSVTDLQTRGHFTYSKNMAGVTREVGDSECYTAVCVIGADITDPDTGEVTGRHEVYLESQNPDDLAAWGKPMPDGTIGHSVYTVKCSEDQDIELLELAANTLEDIVTPDVTYTVDISDMTGIRLREYIDTVDEDLNVRMRARVTSIKQDLLDETRGGQVTFGKTMNYAAVAASYQSDNVVTASSNTDTAKTNRVVSPGRGSDSTTARVSTAERQIADLNERINSGSGGGGGLSWPLIANRGWWNSDDSFAFFNKGGQWGITGKDDNLGVYATADGATPDPQNQQWGDGSEIWKALSGTDARTGATGFFLHAVNAAAQFFRFTSDPTTSHIYTALLNGASYGRALGFYYTNGATGSEPFVAIEPTAAAGGGVMFTTGRTASKLRQILRAVTFSRSADATFSAPIAPSDGADMVAMPLAGVYLHGEGTAADSGVGNRGTADVIARYINNYSDRKQARLMLNPGSASASPSSWLMVQSGSGNYGLKVDTSGVYVTKDNLNVATLHTF